MIKKTITEVKDFHKRLESSRYGRFVVELNIKKKEQKQYLELLDDVQKKLNSNYAILNTHGEVKELIALQVRLEKEKLRKEKLNEFREVSKKYEKQILEYKKDFSDGNLETVKYLENIEVRINEISSKLYELCKTFYNDKYCNFEIKNNTKDNKVRFDLNFKIQDDNSDGINAIKIFCFDFLLFSFNVTKNKFLFHDSRLISNVDSRQRATLFRFISSYLANADKQYIITLNEDVLTTIRNEMNDEEYNCIFKSDVFRITLSDESPQDKLLGIQIDMKDIS